MSFFSKQHILEEKPSLLRNFLSFPFRLAGKVVGKTVQILFALFVLILHPQLKWIFQLIARSTVVQAYIKPSLRGFIVHVYDPYFEYLSKLPPYWATFSIAVPLAILEPAKFVATILIAERPRAGILLWLALQGVSLVLIDRTWVAVRPQSRKIWIVSQIHAWGWLNVAYGKYWIRKSSIYQSALRWRRRAGRTARTWLAKLRPRRRKRS